MNAQPLLAVQDLQIQAGTQRLMEGLSFELGAGGSLILLGESGAGKSLVAQAIMGNLPQGLHAEGQIQLLGQRSRAADAAARRAHWGRGLALLPQEPTQALDPLMPIRRQLSLVHTELGGVSRAAAQQRALQTLQQQGLGQAAMRYPWQLSGGMAQRATAAIALAGGAPVLIVDEPTKGLDAQWRAHTLALLQAVLRNGGCVLAITHDLALAEALGGQCRVLCRGRVVEQGTTGSLLSAPRHPFTQQLLQADPARWPPRPRRAPGALLLEARGLGCRRGGRLLFQNLDLQVFGAQRLAVLGPSGSGKSTLGNLLLNLLKADAGSIWRAPGLAPTACQKLYQDPVTAFAPHRSLHAALEDVRVHHGTPRAQLETWLQRLRIPSTLLGRCPTQVSGGELQRIAIARALLAAPAVLFADEPTSRLDPLSQQDAIGLLLDAADDIEAALLLVTHDDALASAVSTHTVRLAAA